MAAARRKDLEDLLATDAETAARLLIGCLLLKDGVGGIIVETEAYDEDDPASHAFSGPTRRNATLFGPAGRIYVYRSYGLHWCMNITSGREGRGSGTLIRALAPVEGLALMQARRRTTDLRRLCAGPGRLTAALDVTGADDGSAVAEPPFRLLGRQGEPEIVAGPRIGITKATDRSRRFGLAGSPWLSRPFPR
jgi:DNA-3-methyladenine glycosylase